MKGRQIINIINFVREIEPRCPMNLMTPFLEQIELMKKHNLRGTFLIQYDTMMNSEYRAILQRLDPNQFEIGVWHEIVQGQVEACGIKWRGRWAWDWHTHCGFSVGYTKREREMIADEMFEKFKGFFGYYPRTLGSWLFDTHTIRYLDEKYGLDAVCNCKEQFGTDGYTLWGGYYGQAYYPSKNNIFMPASSEDMQIKVPLFRMLGSDPVRQFDYLLDVNREEAKGQDVVTLEPVYTKNNCAGGVPSWVDWFMEENFNGDCLTFGYAQAGQENPFGWEKMKDGLIYQFAVFEKLQKEGKITVEQFGETGRRYKETYEITPPSAICAHTGHGDDDVNSVWYCTKNYRINLYGEHGSFRIRDLHIFSDASVDPYENEVCKTNYAVYETLPLYDGNRYSGKGVWAGGYITYTDGSTPVITKHEFADLGGGRALVNFGELAVELFENGLEIRAAKPFVLDNIRGIDGGHMPNVLSVTDDKLTLMYGGVKYGISAVKGSIKNADRFVSDGCTLTLEIV